MNWRADSYRHHGAHASPPVMLNPNLGQAVGERYEIIRLVGSGG